MRLIIVFILLSILLSCSHRTMPSSQDEKKVQSYNDSVCDILQRDYASLQLRLDSTLFLLNRANVSFDKQIIKRDSLQQLLFISDYKLYRIQHYVDICKKETNKKYLYGWIRRVLEN